MTTGFSPHLSDAQAQRLLDGVLRPDEADEVTAHAEACTVCAALVESYRALSAELEALPVSELPDDFTAGVLARVEQHERTAARERGSAAIVVASVLAALAGLVAFGGGSAWIPTATQFADELGVAAHTFRLGAEILPPVLVALRLPIGAICAALFLLVAFVLHRLAPAPRPQPA